MSLLFRKGCSSRKVRRSALILLSAFFFSGPALSDKPVGDAVNIGQAAGVLVGNNAKAEYATRKCSENFPELAWLMESSYEIRLAELAKLMRAVERHTPPLGTELITQSMTAVVEKAVNNEMPADQSEQYGWCMAAARVNLQPQERLEERFPNTVRLLTEDLEKNPINPGIEQGMNAYAGCMKKSYEKHRPVSESKKFCSCTSNRIAQIKVPEACNTSADKMPADCVHTLTEVVSACASEYRESIPKNP